MKKLLIVVGLLATVCFRLPAQNPNQTSFEQITRVKMALDEVNVTISRISGSTVIVKENTGSSLLSISSSEGTLDVRQHTSIGFFTSTPVLSIQVPENINIEIRMKDGKIELEQLVGTFQIHTNNGDITANISPTGTSYIESESGTVDVKLMDGLAANLYLSAGSGRGTVDFTKHPINAKVKMESFYRSGSIKASFDFKEVHITRSYGPDMIVKLAELGNHEHLLSLSTGGGTIQIKQ